MGNEFVNSCHTVVEKLKNICFKVFLSYFKGTSINLIHWYFHLLILTFSPIA